MHDHAVSRRIGTSFIPHFGQTPGLFSMTSTSCGIGQMYEMGGSCSAFGCGAGGFAAGVELVGVWRGEGEAVCVPGRACAAALSGFSGEHPKPSSTAASATDNEPVFRGMNLFYRGPVQRFQ